MVLDGFDIGAGIVHLLIARTDAERRNVLRTIGPVWDGNEVWLLAAGGTLYFAFPVLYASSFSGFYLPLIIVLWLLVLRGISIEFRSHLDSPLWRPFWDVVFAGSSLLLAVFFGAALGNVVRGVPLDGTGYFFLPLWSDFRASSFGGILDWYTVMTGIAALLALAMHGSLWIALKTGEPVGARADDRAPHLVGRGDRDSGAHSGQFCDSAASGGAVSRSAVGVGLPRDLDHRIARHPLGEGCGL